ncbi:hypothetical protein FMEAI12_7090080 [Parafrankia sp. Ea1.12]|nr:hypothetical protein FMEAI12_7090080 [Parafrankia sp. Ea1.12]
MTPAPIVRVSAPAPRTRSSSTRRSATIAAGGRVPVRSAGTRSVPPASSSTGRPARASAARAATASPTVPGRCRAVDGPPGVVMGPTIVVGRYVDVQRTLLYVSLCSLLRVAGGDPVRTDDDHPSKCHGVTHIGRPPETPDRFGDGMAPRTGADRSRPEPRPERRQGRIPEREI